MQSMINKDFENLPQRGIYYFLATFPSFYPIKSDVISENEQHEAYAFIKSIYDKLYADPTLLGFKLTPDEYFNDWEPQKVKPALPAKIRGVIKKVETFIEILYNIALTGEAENRRLSVTAFEIKSTQIKQLACFGVETTHLGDKHIFTFPASAKALQWLAKVSAEHTQSSLLFSRAVFDPMSPYTLEIFGNMFTEREPFDRLVAFLDKNGYKRVDTKDRQHGISLDYVMDYGNPDEPLKWAWAERTHSGIEVVYEELQKNQLKIALRIPYFGELLKNTHQMDESVLRFITDTAKKCDNCRYCVQTDKTGERPLIYTDVGEYKICPLFCGFQFRWRYINAALADSIIAMLYCIDTIFIERKALRHG